MRCYQCERVASTLFPVLRAGKGHKAVAVTIYVCAECHKALRKEAKE